MRTTIPVLNLSRWLGQATVPIQTYEVANLMQQVATYAKNGKSVAAMVALSKSDPAAYAAAMGSDADAFLTTARDSDSHVPDVQAFQTGFVPVGSKNQIDPAMRDGVNAWINDQQALAGYLKDHPSGSVPAAPIGPTGLPASVWSPSPALVAGAVLFGAGSVVYLIVRKIFF